jgi:hypothetical protein
MTLVWGRYDTLHAPNLRRWMCKEPKASTSASTAADDGLDLIETTQRKVRAWTEEPRQSSRGTPSLWWKTFALSG